MILDNIPKDELDIIYENSIIKAYEKDEIIFSDHDKPMHINVLLEGSLNICNFNADGKRIIITSIHEYGDIFGEVFLFIDSPFYEHIAIATEHTKILKIPKDLIYEHTKLTQNLMSIFAKKAYFLNRRVNVLSCSTLREKILLYIKYNTKANASFYLNKTKDELADFLNVARPSLSRELIKMQNDGVISVNGKKITIMKLKV